MLVTSDVEQETILLDAFEAGADGYISKQSPLTDLFESHATVARGEAWVPPSMVGVVLRRLITRRRREDAALQRFTPLSRREVEVLALLAKGKDQDAIATALFISPETARTHIQNIITKLGVHSRQEAVALVLEFELLKRFSEGGGNRRDADDAASRGFPKRRDDVVVKMNAGPGPPWALIRTSGTRSTTRRSRCGSCCDGRPRPWRWSKPSARCSASPPTTVAADVWRALDAFTELDLIEWRPADGTT